MGLSFKRGEIIAFRNPDILNVDTKRVTLERVLVALFQNIYSGGAPLKLKARRKEHSIETLEGFVSKLEESGKIIGASENMEAVEDWLRSDLLEMVYRGNVVKEKVAALKPVHLLCFRVQNRKYCRDYMTADQLYLMLRSHPEVLNGLKQYLQKGWDAASKSIVHSDNLDVNTTGVLMLTQGLSGDESRGLNSTVDITKPFLEKQTDLFNDDIRRLLLYQDKLPRVVFIDYLRILCGFHLALYTMKLVMMLPRMVELGTKDIPDDWSMVVDMTDNLDSRVSHYACLDTERLVNNYRAYVRATYKFNLIQNTLRNENKDCSVQNVLKVIHDKSFEESEYRYLLNHLKEKLDDENKKYLDEKLQYFDDTDYFNKYVYILESSNQGNSQCRFLKEFIDAVSMKNSPSMLLADGRSRRHARRGAMGSKLLETLVQLMVIEKNEDGNYYTQALSIDELAEKIRCRYGLIINGVNDSRIEGADVDLHAAFKENMDAFKNKLRQIGFYTDLSDAYILQKIHPRYKID